MEPRISIITLGVDDLDRSIAFYRDRLGLPTEGPSDDICFFKLQGAWLSLFPRNLLAEDGGVEVARGWGGMTIAHNVRDKESVDAIIALAEDAGAEITARPSAREWGGYTGYFRDLDGHLWEVCWNPYFPID